MTADSRVKTTGDIKTAHLFDITIDLNPQLNIGSGPFGQRVLFGAAGGSFDGPVLRGEVLPGGGDWALFRADGTMTLDVRLTLRTHDAALVHMTYGGRWVIPAELRSDISDPVNRHHIDPARYYLRTNPLFETGARQYTWLNDIVCVGSGYLIEGGIAYKISQIILKDIVPVDGSPAQAIPLRRRQAAKTIAWHELPADRRGRSGILGETRRRERRPETGSGEKHPRSARPRRQGRPSFVVTLAMTPVHNWVISERAAPARTRYHWTGQAVQAAGYPSAARHRNGFRPRRQVEHHLFWSIRSSPQLKPTPPCQPSGAFRPPAAP